VSTGISAGVGKCNFDYRYTGLFGNPFDRNRGDYYSFGLDLKYTPKKELFAIYSGVEYFKRYSIKDYGLGYPSKFNHMKIPLGMDFHVGEKIGFIVGTGIYGSYLLKYSNETVPPSIEESIKRFQFGIDIGVGLISSYFSSFTFLLKYQNSLDLSYLYTDYVSSSQHRSSFRGLSSKLVLGCYYSWDIK
jgi:hypothetical protein